VEWSDLGFFIAIATDGFIAYSSDGFNWIDSVLTGGLRGGCWSRELGIFVIVGLDNIYTSSLKNIKPTNENIFNNEFNSIDEDGTWTFNSLNTSSILLNGSSFSTLIGDKQNELTTGANITIEGDEISCDLTAGTNINISTDGVISTTGLQNELTAGANITIEGDEISCDLKAGTNINITGSIISTTGLQNELTAGANITIKGDEVSCDLTAGTNIDITGGILSTTGLQNELTAGANITIERDEVSCDLTAGTNIDITGGIISTTGLHTTIDDTSVLDVKSLKTEVLSVNDINNNDTREFNTIVIRRPKQTFGGASPLLLIRELQCWVNDKNILVDNANNLVSYFVLFSGLDNSETSALDPADPLKPASNAYNNDITGNFDTTSSDNVDVALIIKNIPLTLINNIQSVVFYPRLESTTADRTIDIGIELYNTNDDPNLGVALEATIVIDTYFQVYRYDFASIISYGLGFSNSTTSTTQIVSGAIAPIEVVVAPPTSTGEVAISGTQINFNSDSFISIQQEA
jgi:uncharacterized Zn-binding protein involved in type VI secretion